MRLFKFNLIVFSLFAFTQAYALFTDNECLMASFDASVSHKGKPWGLSENLIKVQKTDCLMVFESERMKLFREKWVVDVCRGPVHLKMGTEGVEVIKREKPCTLGDKKPHKFCKLIQELDTVIQDDGLIFVEGRRESLSSDHGKMFCSYLLTMSYLRDGLVFNRDIQYQDVLMSRSASSTKVKD